MLRKVALLATVMAGTVQAAEIHIIIPGSGGGGMKAQAESWAAATGNKATVETGGSGQIRTDVGNGKACDVVALPPSEFPAITAAIKPNSLTFVGTIPMAAVVKAGTPHPNISTLPKFIATVKAMGTGYADPARGSTSGAQVAKMLQRPEFAGAKGTITQGAPASAVARGDVPFGIGTLSEDSIPGVDVIGNVPPELGMRLDISAAVCAKAIDPAAAASFIAFITRPEAAADWKKGYLILGAKK